MMNSGCAVLCITFVLALWLILTYNKCARDDGKDSSSSSDSTEHMTGYGIISGLAFNNKANYFPGGINHSSGYSIPHRVII
jgi:hypothetical protein